MVLKLRPLIPITFYRQLLQNGGGEPIFHSQQRVAIGQAFMETH